MPAPFQVRDQDRPGVDLGEWDEDGNLTIPGTLSAGGITGPAGEVVFSALVAAFVTVASTDLVLSAQVEGDTDPRFSIDAEGRLRWGDGSGATDCTFYRYAATGLAIDGALRLTNDQMLFGAAGDVNLYRDAAEVLRTDDSFEIAQGLRVVEGTAGATMGRATLVAGGATVNTTAITANSQVFITVQVPGGSVGSSRVASRIAGTSFTIASSQGTDTSTVAWLIVEPATL